MTTVNKNPRRAVFFDVTGKTSPVPAARRLRIPNWWRRSTEAAPAPREDAPTDDITDAPAPIVWRTDGQLIISLGQIGKIVAGASLCVLFLVGFGLGRKSVGTAA